MGNRQIALFTADWNYELVGETLRGISRFVAEHPDVKVRVFDCFGIDAQSIHDPCVYEIYHQAALDQYDGVIIQTNQIVMKEILDGLMRRIHEAGIPALSIGTALGDFPQILTDDEAAFREIACHLIDRHGVRRPWFLKGAEQYDSCGEAVLRRRGFTDGCRMHGLDPDGIRFLDGDWKGFSGEAAAREILALPPAERPDALACANDDMALGAMFVLREAGIAVPEDIIVTGYDGIFSASLCTPRMATVKRHFDWQGYRAMEIILRMADGERVPEVSLSPVQPDLVGTCGCPGNEEKHIARIKDRFFLQTTFLHAFYLRQDKLTAALFAAASLPDVMDSVERYSDVFGAESVRIYLDEKYYEGMISAVQGIDAELPRDHYSGRFVLTADSRGRSRAEQAGVVVPAGETQRRDVESRSGITVYYPLRYREIMVGILILGGTSEAAEMNLHESIINLIVLSLETVRQRKIMNRLNEQMSRLYVTDQLTGLYNRFGLTRFGEPLFRELTEQGRAVCFLFVDIDNMKEINDRLGHENGDAALRAAADLLRRVSRAGDFLMRYGGDEFVLFGPAGGRNWRFQLREEQAAMNEHSDWPFRLSLSAGEYVHLPEDPLTMEECLKRADEAMYREKKQKKQGGKQ